MFLPCIVFVILVLANSNMSRASEEGSKQYDEGLKRGNRVQNGIGGCQGSRIPISILATMNKPFRSVVRITGQDRRCSGILIGPRHVLTSAHCVHNRTALTSPLASFKVGIVQYSRTLRILTTYFVKKVFVARLYKTGRDKSAKDDYAVLKLQLPHGRRYLKMKAISDFDLAVAVKRTVHFAGFPQKKHPNQMWYTSCALLRWESDAIISSCVAKSGSSGSGVYVLKPRNKRVVIGVLSGVKGNNCSTVTTRLTASKIKEICSWIGRETCRS